MLRCWHRPQHLEPIDWIGFGVLFSAKFVLEVLAASGAIWGFSEVVTLRDASTNDVWRIVALLVGLVFLYRFWLHGKHYLEHDYEFPPIKLLHHRHHKTPFLQIFSSKLILHVLGAGGAIWGSSEASGWRTPETLEFWRPVALSVATLFGIQWVIEMMLYCKATDHHVENNEAVRWYKLLVCKFILEVLGGAAAIWGSSQVVTLRNDDTLWFWRPVTMGFGVLFLIRWVRLIQEERRNARQARHAEEEEEAETSDLVLTEIE